MSTDKKELRAQLARIKDEVREATGRVHDAKTALDAAQRALSVQQIEADVVERELARLEPLGKLAAKAMAEARDDGHFYAKRGSRAHDTAHKLVNLDFMMQDGSPSAWGLRYALTDLGRAKLAEVKP